MEIRQAEAELVHAERRTGGRIDRHTEGQDEGERRFSWLCKRH